MLVTIENKKVNNSIYKESLLLMQSPRIVEASAAPSKISLTSLSSSSLSSSPSSSSSLSSSSSAPPSQILVESLSTSSSSLSSSSSFSVPSLRSSSSASFRDEESPLGKNFKPGNWDVICGRGKASYNHIGNRRFRVFVASYLQQYVNVSSQKEKSNITSSIINQIRENAISIGGFGFVGRDTSGKWHEVGNMRAREKVGHTFRDSMRGALLRRNNNQFTSDEIETSIKEAQDKVFGACHLLARKAKKKKSKSKELISSLNVNGTKNKRTKLQSIVTTAAMP